MQASMALELREEADFWIGGLHSSIESVTATVVIPAFNAADTLVRAARSALNQTLRDIEIIIVDDASTDSSWHLITGLIRTDSRIRVLRNKQNRGKSAAMNRAMTLARGRWLAVLDADDWYHAERMSRLVRLADQRNADLVADNQFLFDALANHLVGTAWPDRNSAWELTFDDFLIGSDVFENFNLGMLKPVLRLDFMLKMGQPYEEIARQGEDFLHLLQFYLAGGRAVISDIPYYYYTQPFGAISHQWSQPSRTRYDFQNAWDINQRYLRKADPVLTCRQRARLTARNHRLKVLETYFLARDACSRKNWGAAVALLASQPAALNYLFRRLYERCLPGPASGTIRRIAARSRRRDMFGAVIPPGSPSKPGESDA